MNKDRIVLVVLALVAVVASVPATAEDKYTSVDHYIHTMCTAQQNHLSLAFYLKSEGREKTGARKVAAEIIRRWEANLQLDGMPDYKIPWGAKEHMFTLVEDVFSGKWRSSDEMMLACILGRKGTAFPPHLYSELGKVERYFEKKNSERASVIRTSQKK